MRHRKLAAMLGMLTLGAAFSVGAEIIVQAPPPDSQVAVVPEPATVVIAAAPVPAEPVIVVRSVVPTPVPDPAADAKCRYMAPGSYWDCVNSHNGGQ